MRGKHTIRETTTIGSLMFKGKITQENKKKRATELGISLAPNKRALAETWSKWVFKKSTQSEPATWYQPWLATLGQAASQDRDPITEGVLSQWPWERASSL